MNEDEQTACYIGKNKYESNIDSKSNYTFFNNLNKPTKSTRTTKSSKVFGTCCEFVQCSTNIPGDKLLHFLSNKCDLSIEPLGEVKKFDRVTRWIFCRTSTHTLKRNTLFLATAWSNPLPTHFSNRKSFAHDVSINFYDPIPFHPRRAKAVLLETLERTSSNFHELVLVQRSSNPTLRCTTFPNKHNVALQRCNSVLHAYCNHVVPFDRASKQHSCQSVTHGRTPNSHSPDLFPSPEFDEDRIDLGC